MESYQAIQAAVNGKSVEHAKRLGVSLSLVSKWQEPSLEFTDSGAYNPLDRVETVIRTSRDLGNEPERHLAPLHYLAAKFGQIVFPAPAPGKNLSDLQQELSKLVKEFGDVLTESGKRLGDGDVSSKDARAITKEAQEVQRALSSFIAKLSAEALKNQ